MLDCCKCHKHCWHTSLLCRLIVALPPACVRTLGSCLRKVQPPASHNLLCLHECVACMRPCRSSADMYPNCKTQHPHAPADAAGSPLPPKQHTYVHMHMHHTPYLCPCRFSAEVHTAAKFFHPHLPVDATGAPFKGSTHVHVHNTLSASVPPVWPCRSSADMYPTGKHSIPTRTQTQLLRPFPALPQLPLRLWLGRNSSGRLDLFVGLFDFV
jgi:hypothetical protein